MTSHFSRLPTDQAGISPESARTSMSLKSEFYKLHYDDSLVSASRREPWQTHAVEVVYEVVSPVYLQYFLSLSL